MDAYQPLEMIGKGSFGTVQKIRRKADGKMLVWKEIDYGKMSEKEKHLLVSEVNILREFRHAHIVRYYDRIIDKSRTKIYIVMEYCAGGDLAAYIKKCRREKKRIDEEVIWKVFLQMGLALQQCHLRKEGTVLHRDLKPANVFLDIDNNVKLGDFGLARTLGSESLFARTHVGTPYYMSPEQIGKKAYNERTDIWALGCILYEMACLHTPFEAQTEAVLAAKIKAGRIHKLPSCYSDALARAIYSMIQVDMSKRPRIQDLLALPQVAMRLAKVGAATESKEPTSRPTTAKEPTPRPSTAVPAPKPAAAVPEVRLPERKRTEEPRRPTTAWREPTPRGETPRDQRTALELRSAALKKKEEELAAREATLKKRESKLAAREEERAAKARAADNLMTQAERLMSDYQSKVASTARTTATVGVPFDDKENPSAGKGHVTTMQNVHERREQLLARLLNHRNNNQ